MPPPATRARYFVTAPGVRVSDSGGSAAVIEGGPFHAKRMGTTLTACGRIAASWPKLWDVPFATVVGPLCQGCTDAVARD